MSKSLEMSSPRLLSDALPTAAVRSSRLRSDGVECPKCSKRSIVKRTANTFDCLNCNFHKELPPVAGSAAYSIGNPLLNRRLTDSQFTYIKGHPNNGRSPLYPTLDSLEEDGERDALQPFVFASLAVIIGIVLL